MTGAQEKRRMKEFTEKHHAWLVGRFYGRLMQECPDRGEAIFVMSTQRYAEQRGSRMAQRAVRDGKGLNFTTYREYGEWKNTETVKREGCANAGETTAWSPDHVEKVYMCPWAAQFKEMGLKKCGTLYCRHVDQSIVRGFNPLLTYEVPQSMHESGYCLQISRGADFREGQVFNKRTEYQKTFDYHCGHCYKTFREIVTAILGEQGERISRSVLQEFGKTYGEEMAAVLLSYQDQDFNLI